MQNTQNFLIFHTQLDLRVFKNDLFILLYYNYVMIKQKHVKIEKPRNNVMCYKKRTNNLIKII